MSEEKNEEKEGKGLAGVFKNWMTGTSAVKIDLRRAVFGGMIAFVVFLLGSWLVGVASGSEAYHLFKTTLPSTRSFCGTLLLALGNILALMLTLLSLSASMDIDIKWTHYQRVRQISWVVTVTLIITTLTYLVLNIPMMEAEKTKIYWFTYIYYALLVLSSVLGGSFVTIVLLLYNTVRDMIGVMHPDSEHHLKHVPEEEEEEE